MTVQFRLFTYFIKIQWRLMRIPGSVVLPQKSIWDHQIGHLVAFKFRKLSRRRRKRRLFTFHQLSPNYRHLAIHGIQHARFSPLCPGHPSSIPCPVQTAIPTDVIIDGSRVINTYNFTRRWSTWWWPWFAVDVATNRRHMATVGRPLLLSEIDAALFSSWREP